MFHVVLFLGWFPRMLQSTWIGNSSAGVGMTRLLVRFMCKGDGLLDCSCIMGDGLLDCGCTERHWTDPCLGFCSKTHWKDL